jgi:hypothetical protein
LLVCDFVIVYNVMYAIGELYFPTFLGCIMMTGIFLILSFTFLEFYKSRYFSGFPYINKKAQRSLKHMKSVICFWVFGKFIEISICAYLLLFSTFSQTDLYSYLEGKSLLGFSLYLIYALNLVITELIPGRFVLERQFLDIFKGEKEVEVSHESSIDSHVVGDGHYVSLKGLEGDLSFKASSGRVIDI